MRLAATALIMALTATGAAFGPAEAQDGVETVETTRVRAEVLSVDREAGQMLLRNLDTGEMWVHEPEGGLPGVLGLVAGDKVSALRTRGVTAYDAPADMDPTPTVDAFSRKGERDGKPAMVTGRLVTQVVTLDAWDSAKRLATVTLGDGTTSVYEIGNDDSAAFLDRHEAGQRFVVEVSETDIVVDETP